MQPEKRDLAFINATILDGTADMQPRSDSIVIVRDGTIAHIAEAPVGGDAYAHAKRLAPGARIINLAGAYLMPGLINLHAHFIGSGTPVSSGNASALIKLAQSNPLGRALIHKLIKSAVVTQLASGVTTVRGAGDNRGVENDVDYYGVEAYAAKRFGQFNVVGHVGYTRTKNDLTDSSIGYAKVDDLDADVWNVGVRGEMQFAVTDKSRLVPYVGINYLRVSTDGYTTSQGVSVSSEDQNLFTVPVGVAFKGTMTTASGWNWSPSADIAYVGAFGDRDVEATTRDGLASGSVSMDVWSENVVRTSFGLEAEKGGFGIGAMAGLAVGSDDTTGAFGQIRVHYAF